MEQIDNLGAEKSSRSLVTMAVASTLAATSLLCTQPAAAVVVAQGPVINESANGDEVTFTVTPGVEPITAFAAFFSDWVSSSSIEENMYLKDWQAEKWAANTVEEYGGSWTGVPEIILDAIDSVQAVDSSFFDGVSYGATYYNTDDASYALASPGTYGDFQATTELPTTPVIAVTTDGTVYYGETGETLSAVPIPAALPLFGTALLGFGLMGFRRRE